MSPLLAATMNVCVLAVASYRSAQATACWASARGREPRSSRSGGRRRGDAAGGRRRLAEHRRAASPLAHPLGGDGDPGDRACPRPQAVDPDQARDADRCHGIRRRSVSRRRHQADAGRAALPRLRLRAAAGDPPADDAGRAGRADLLHGDGDGYRAGAHRLRQRRMRAAGREPDALPGACRDGADLRLPCGLSRRRVHRAHRAARAVDERVLPDRGKRRVQPRPPGQPRPAGLGRHRARVRRHGKVLGGGARRGAAGHVPDHPQAAARADTRLPRRTRRRLLHSHRAFRARRARGVRPRHTALPGEPGRRARAYGAPARARDGPRRGAQYRRPAGAGVVR